MELQKKRKIKKWFKEHKAIIIGAGSVIIVGLIAMLIGFEIQQDWHAIRNWLASPYASTFFICLVLGVVVLGLIIAVLINLRRGDDE